MPYAAWQGQGESNTQPSVLETDALPIELCSCMGRKTQDLHLLELGIVHSTSRFPCAATSAKAAA